MTASPSLNCASAAIVAQRYVGDAWTFTFFYYSLASDGVTQVPVDLSDFVMTGVLLRGPQALATLQTTTDGTTALASGRFKFVAPSSLTLTVPPDPPKPLTTSTRLAVVQTDAAGNPTTLAVLPLVVSLR